MNLSRRQVLTLAAGAATGLTMLRINDAHATPEAAMEMVNAFAGGEPEMGGGLSLNTPEIAENGNTVPVSVTVESPMTADDYVASVMILADGNPNPEVITFNFTPMSGSAIATTRIRLAKTQNVIAVAKTSTGKTFMDKKEVKVTIGGCGG